MGWRYGDYLDGRERSDRWSRSTGYTSNNYQHSMVVESIDPAEDLTQDDVYDLLEEYTFWAVSSASLNLMVAKKGELEGSMDADDIDLSWVAGLRYVGSVFHLVEDSSVTCSDAARELVPSCIPGDGHTLIEKVDGRSRVVALSNNEYYERTDENGDKVHGQLDGLHQEELVAEVYGDSDPALDTSQILVLVAQGVDRAVHEDLAAIPLFIDGEPNPEFDSRAFSLSADIARDVMAQVIDPRFADPSDRVELPAIADGDDRPEDRVGGDSEGDGQSEAGGCRVGGSSPIGGWLLLLLGGAFVARRRRH
jgi:MYXO-CTERM domain-containing protein